MTQFIPLILFSVLTNFASQVMLKKGMTELPQFDLSVAAVVGNSLNIVFSPWVFFGLVTMVVSMGSHLVVLSRVDISFAYPFLGLSFGLVTLWGYFVLNESVTSLRVAGVALIFLGVFMVSRSSS